MVPDSYKDLQAYNSFCSNLKEGYIIYNIDTTNSWGEYFLVANIATVRLKDTKTYTVMLLGLKKDNKTFIPRNFRIKLTPDYAANIPFLKYVGHCNYRIIPEIKDVELNLGLVTVYGSVDLWRYKEKLCIRKPKRRKYGKDGKLILKKSENE